MFAAKLLSFLKFFIFFLQKKCKKSKKARKIRALFDSNAIFALLSCQSSVVDMQYLQNIFHACICRIHIDNCIPLFVVAKEFKTIYLFSRLPGNQRHGPICFRHLSRQCGPRIVQSNCLFKSALSVILTPWNTS